MTREGEASVRGRCAHLTIADWRKTAVKGDPAHGDGRSAQSGLLTLNRGNRLTAKAPPGAAKAGRSRFQGRIKHATGHRWRRALGALKVLGFDGAFSVHTEYDFDESIIRQVGYADTTPPHLEEWARADAAYLRTVWAGVTGEDGVGQTDRYGLP